MLVVPVMVLLVNVSVVFRATNVSVLVGRVKVPVLEMELIFGNVNVLLVKVSVVVLAINVSVLVGSVKVPVLEMELIFGKVNVLLVRVCVPVNVTNEVTGIVPFAKVLTTVLDVGPLASPLSEIAGRSCQVATPSGSDVNTLLALALVGMTSSLVII